MSRALVSAAFRRRLTWTPWIPQASRSSLGGAPTARTRVSLGGQALGKPQKSRADAEPVRRGAQSEDPAGCVEAEADTESRSLCSLSIRVAMVLAAN